MYRAVLVGSPNVGKSAVFNCLTGKYVSVSNYPGTTVEVARGYGKAGGRSFEYIDTPGMYSLSPLTDEERVTRRLLQEEKADVVLHVADAKNIRRMLSTTLELIDAGLAVVLVLNMMDEAAAAGVSINRRLLAELLGVPVVCMAAVRKTGLEELKKTLGGFDGRPAAPQRFSPELEQAIDVMAPRLTGRCALSGRIMALLLLQGDEDAHALVRGAPHYARLVDAIRKTEKNCGRPMVFAVAAERQAMADNIARLTVSCGAARSSRAGAWLERLTREPLTGIPILALVLYLGLYKFVGGFGAGYLVDHIDRTVFTELLTPALQQFTARYVPWEWLASLLAGEYGVFTLGLRYAAAIILPVVGTFFLAFAVIEDSGYLPRLAMLTDRIFKQLGLNGRAVIPVTLGLGCGTMAVFVTRTLETKRERLLATFLLALAIPCSAQLGVVLGVLAHNPATLAVWAAYIAAVFAVSGWLAARLLPGRRSPFYMELPPLRLPLPGNVVKKAYTRMIWYFIEIIPVFIFASFILWLGDRTGLLAHIITAVEPVMVWLGLPAAAAQVFLLGFFRRDYGAAGLYDMAASGMLSDRQLLVATVTLTLFVPCVAQFMVMVRERGTAAACLIAALTALIAFGSGWAVGRLAELLLI